MTQIENRGISFYIGRKLAVPESVAKAGFRGGPFYIGSKMNEECLFGGVSNLS